MTIPHICLFAPGDGTPEVMKVYEEALLAKEKGGKNVVETFETMHHGWMGARADLEREDNVREFERG